MKQNGAILIIVLWFIVVVTIIVAALATETRLSAKVVIHNKNGLQQWNDTLQALRSAEMELLINRMPDPAGEEKPVNEAENKNEPKENKKYRFNGQVIELAYPIPDTVAVRIYDHAGKINLLRLSKKHRRQILENRIGNDDLAKLDALEDAWQDWIDKDDFKRVNGAEKDYYETLEPPYEPRNARLETVEELLLIKGFDEVFKDFEITTAFTVYGSYKVNPNLATREALMLVPGMDEESVNKILIKRRQKKFKSYKDFNDFLEPEQLAKFRNWINFATSRYYSIAVQVKPPTEKSDEEPDEDEDDDKQEDDEIQAQENQRAYMVTVQPRGFNQLPRILMVNPYGVLPDTSHELMEDEEEDSEPDTAKKTSPFPFL